ncbi:hypothetical protein [Amycolatopsis sp. 195334CR]|uniref:hypothetical protein n=1 Tax=Amycolatopsis sp. 195334CR TaxID=2814588 RepID=UPI001A8FA593|nr:hypothetical protein [Amycolatopsis sp. 195334CR]MBN6035241.1 hypothetical protein [Amycolatopsis sp. 195334CR]
MSEDSTVGQVEAELRQLAQGDGLAAGKLVGTNIFRLASPPESWRKEDICSALVRLVDDLASSLPNENHKMAVQTSLNIGTHPVSGRLLERQTVLARKLDVHADTVRTWWQTEAGQLASLLTQRIRELNIDQALWDEYHPFSLGDNFDSDDHPPTYSFDRIEVSWLFRKRTATELMTQRWIVAHEDNVTGVEAASWYFSDDSPESCEVEPIMNCEKGEVSLYGRGLRHTELKFARTLRRGEGYFYAYRVAVRSQKEMEPLFYHGVRSAGVKHLLCNAQFDPSCLPVKVWSFAARYDAQPYIEPPPGSPRFVTVNRLGFAHKEFKSCQHGVKYGLAWKWQKTPGAPPSQRGGLDVHDE